MDSFSNHTANVFDLTQLNDIRAQSNQASSDEKNAALKKAASQFEAIFMQMLLKSIRQAEDVLASDSPFNSQTTRFYRDMHDQQLAMELSANGTLGLSDLIVRQLGGSDEEYTPHSLLNIGRRSVSRSQSQQDSINEDENKSTAPVQQQQEQKEKSMFSGAADFVNSLSPMVDKAASYLGVPSPVLIAQAALETGWGKKIIQNNNGDSSFNLFNIKADQRWQGDKVAKNTLEFEQGQMINKRENFRVYGSFADSIDDYVSFLTSNDRYADVVKSTGNVEHFLQGLQKAGYATDPNYATKISGIVEKVTNLLMK